MIRMKIFHQPDYFEVTVSFTLKESARANTVEVTVNIQLKHILRRIRWSAGSVELGMVESQSNYIEVVDKNVDYSYWIIFGDVFVNAGRQYRYLISVLA